MASRPGIPIVISAPSGTGKSSVCSRLLMDHPDLVVSISHTTRKPRGAEKEGEHYFFVDDAQFANMVAEGAFLEWAEVYGQRYGSSRAFVEEKTSAGLDVLFDIDVQGGFQIQRALPQALLIFLLPPSAQALVARLDGRRTEDAHARNRRLHAAGREFEQSLRYQFHVINDQVGRAATEIDAIRRGEAHAGARKDEIVTKLASEMRKYSTPNATH